MRAEIIAVGTELLTTGRSESNSVFLAGKLRESGIEVARKWVVADQAQEIQEALELAMQRSDVVIFTGGLGPTSDDITRQAVADFLGLSLQEDPDILNQLRRRYKRFGFELTENNRKQASVPEGATVIPNPRGTAPGLLICRSDVLIFLLPGPPRELYPMVEEQALPLISKYKKTKPLWQRTVKIAGEAESHVDARLSPIYSNYREIETTILSSPGIITLHFYWKGNEDEALADRQLDELVDRVKLEIGQSVYANADLDLPGVLGELLQGQKLTLATAESCTGGLVGKLVTDVAGSSLYFAGGVVCYSNSMKVELLGVKPSTLESSGAVSAPVACEMAEGIRLRTGASIGLSVTGIAGPGGGSREKPVGTVFLGMATEKGIEAKQFLLPGDRLTVRLRSARAALDWVRRSLL